MSFRDLARKYHRMVIAKDNVITMQWVDSPGELTQEQRDSKTQIYLYLEI